MTALHITQFTLHSLRTRQQGQIATFLTLCMALGLTLVMVTTNIGKVGLNRTNTSNAADAGALAAVSWLASGNNCIQQLSTDMFEAYASYVATQALTYLRPYPMPAIGYVLDAIFSAGQIAGFVVPAFEVGESANGLADGHAKLYALLNSGIDDPNLEGGDPAKNNFAEFLAVQSDGIETPSGCGAIDSADSSVANSYSWTDSQGQNRFDVTVGNVPTPAPVWVPGPLVFFSCIPPYVPAIASCLLTAGPATHTALPIPFPDMVASHIVEIINGEGTVQVTTTRYEPDADLRFWQMRYRDPAQPGGGITSSATGWYGGGSPMPFGGDTYDAKLESVQ